MWAGEKDGTTRPAPAKRVAEITWGTCGVVDGVHLGVVLLELHRHPNVRPELRLPNKLQVSAQSTTNGTREPALHLTCTRPPTATSCQKMTITASISHCSMTRGSQLVEALVGRRSMVNGR